MYKLPNPWQMLGGYPSVEEVLKSPDVPRFMFVYVSRLVQTRARAHEPRSIALNLFVDLLLSAPFLLQFSNPPPSLSLFFCCRMYAAGMLINL